MKQDDYARMIEQCGIRPTANRIVVAGALDRAGRPMSMSELEAQIATIDKSGIYRALTEFHKHHLVHTVDAVDGEVRYEFCHSHHSDYDDDRHAHFYCEACHRTFCIDHVRVPQIDVPEGFVPSAVSYTIKGLCSDCALLQHRQ